MKPSTSSSHDVDVTAGFTLVLEFTEEGMRQTLMVPLDREGRALTDAVVRLDDQPLAQTQIGEELIVNGKRQRVVAVAKTLRMRLTFDE